MTNPELDKFGHCEDAFCEICSDRPRKPWTCNKCGQVNQWFISECWCPALTTEINEPTSNIKD